MHDNETPDGDDESALTSRLRAFGDAPLDEELAARTLGHVRATAARARASHVKWVVAAAVAGFMAGSAGLAAADALPDPAQDVAHRVLGGVGVNVPPGHDRYHDPVECPGGPYANHGQYVRAHKGDPDAGTSPCGKPTRAVTGKPGDGEADADDAGERKGPPPWAHGQKQNNPGQPKPKAAGNEPKPSTAPKPTAAPTTTTTTTAAAPTTTTAGTD
jgi:hypothetical protein